MNNRHSRMTAQGQISVPADIRRQLGLAPGSVLEWQPQGDGFFVRKAGRHSSAEVHAALFGKAPAIAGMPVKDGIRAYIRRKHAGR
jgi:antitoxin PrlF